MLKYLLVVAFCAVVIAQDPQDGSGVGAPECDSRDSGVFLASEGFNCPALYETGLTYVEGGATQPPCTVFGAVGPAQAWFADLPGQAGNTGAACTRTVPDAAIDEINSRGGTQYCCCPTHPRGSRCVVLESSLCRGANPAFPWKVCNTTPRPTRTPTRTPTSRAPTRFPTTRGPTPFPTSRGPTSRAPTRFPTTRGPTPFPTTRGPTSRAPTRFPTTRGPTSRAPTRGPTSRAPTRFPTTRGPTPFPTTRGPTSRAPTRFPTSRAPTRFPTTRGPTSRAPTRFPTSRAPTRFPTTRGPTPFPTTRGPTSRAPTRFPTSRAPTRFPTTRAPTSRAPTRDPTAAPTPGPTCTCIFDPSKPPLEGFPINLCEDNNGRRCICEGCDYTFNRRECVEWVQFDILTDTFWSREQTYLVKGEIHVAEGARLTIEPGSVVLFEDWAVSTILDDTRPSHTSTKWSTLVVDSGASIDAQDVSFEGKTHNAGMLAGGLVVLGTRGQFQLGEYHTIASIPIARAEQSVLRRVRFINLGHLGYPAPLNVLGADNVDLHLEDVFVSHTCGVGAAFWGSNLDVRGITVIAASVVGISAEAGSDLRIRKHLQIHGPVGIYADDTSPVRIESVPTNAVNHVRNPQTWYSLQVDTFAAGSIFADRFEGFPTNGAIESSGSVSSSVLLK